jgi:hypothetical protein
LLAARVAARLREDPGLLVERRGGRIGELRIEVDGITAVEAPVLWWPRPSRLVAELRKWLARHPAALD